MKNKTMDKIEKLLKDIEGNTLVKEVHLTKDGYGGREVVIRLYPDQSQKQPEEKAEGTKCEYCGKICEKIYHCDWGWVCGEHCFENPFKKPEKQEEWREDMGELIEMHKGISKRDWGTLKENIIYEVSQLLSERIKKIYKNIEDMPLCYDDGLAENDDDMEFIRGESHFKGHVLEEISKLLKGEE